MWWIFVVLYIISELIFHQFYKVCTKISKKDGALTVLLFTAGISIWLAIPFFNITFSTDWRVYLFLGLAIIFYAIANRINTTIRREIQTSIFVMLKQLSTVFIIIGGAFLFNETLGFAKVLGTILIVFSNIFIFYRKNELKFNKQCMLLSICSNLSMAIAMMLDVSNSNYFSLPIYISMTLICPAFFIIIFERVKINDIKNEYISGKKNFIIATGVVWGLAILFQLRAYQLGKVTTITLLCATTVVLNVLGEFIFLKQKDNLLKKITCAILILIGIVLIKI